MYDNNALNFSFEISAGAVSIVDGISIVDVNEANELTAMAVVSVPAYPESKALDLVAEADDMARFYEHASMLISEVDLETVKCRFHKLLYEVLGDGVYALNVLLFCHDCVILYAFETGMTYKVEYKMDNDDLLITDIYTVDYVRSKGSEEEMFAENMNTEAEAVVEVAEAVAEVEEAIAEVETEVEVEVAEEVIEAEVQVETAEEIVEDVIAEDQEEDKVEDPVQEVEEDKEDEELAELRKRVAELEAENETLSQYKAEIEKIEEEKRIAEVESKKEKLRKYASEEGLSIEEPVIAEAIEALDYEAIVAEVTANKEKAKTEKKDETYVASYTDIGTKGISYLFKSR